MLLLALGPYACARPQPPSVTPHVVRVTGVSPTGLDLDVQLNVSNPNSFPLAAEAVSGTLFVSKDRKLGQGSSNPRSSIPGGGSSLVSCQVHVDWGDMTALVPLLSAPRIPYEFRGDVTLGGRSINLTLPFTLAGELDRAQLLQAGMRGL